ncbi:hypothetical protein [Massilia sp. CT11-137]|uniref:hypothetical protein n=1 Tax=Massilia sp. CT11-137 TaxID=3393901 RepID=UPI0039A67981
MARLGFDRESGLVYEGRGAPTHPVWPTPALTQATLITTPADLAKIPGSFESNPFAWMFVETSFDPVSRIRRGRIFQNFGNVSWERVLVEPHPALFSETKKAAEQGGRVSKELSVYIECTDLLRQPDKGQGLQLALGHSDASSLWRILQTERLAASDVMITLRAESAYNIMPEIDKSKIHPDSVSGVKSAVNRVLDAAYRELPTSVVDQCRNAATVLVSRWMQVQTGSSVPVEQDLGAWIKTVRSHFGEGEMVALRSALETINRLHPRGKDNEASRYQLRSVTESDAEFAVQALGFVIREIRWAV